MYLLTPFKVPIHRGVGTIVSYSRLVVDGFLDHAAPDALFVRCFSVSVVILLIHLFDHTALCHGLIEH